MAVDTAPPSEEDITSEATVSPFMMTRATAASVCGVGLPFSTRDVRRRRRRAMECSDDRFAVHVAENITPFFVFCDHRQPGVVESDLLHATNGDHEGTRR